jgi:WD40 repeat protein
MRRLETLASRLLLRLEGHVSAITDIHFSHVGDRVLTASLLDGTVRVWAFSRDFKKSGHIVLNMSQGLVLQRLLRPSRHPFSHAGPQALPVCRWRT